MCAFCKHLIRFIETNMSITAESEKLQINAAQRCNLVIITLTLSSHICIFSIRDKRMILTDIDCIKKVMTHEIYITLITCNIQSYILIQVHGIAF